MSAKNRKKSFVVVMAVFFVGLLLALAPVTPPLLDRDNRNIAEKGHDLILFGFHFNAAILFQSFHMNEKAEREMARAAWHNKKMMGRIFGDDDNLELFAQGYEALGILNIAIDIRKYQLRETPIPTNLLSELGKLLRKDRRWKEAESVYQKMVSHHGKNHVHVWYYLGLVHSQLGKIQESISDFEKAIEYDVAFADAYYQLALLYESDGNKNKALEMFQKSASHLPNHLDALMGINRVISANEKTK